MNKYQPHLLVIPEDGANRQIANGFLLDPSVRFDRIQVLGEVGGWHYVIKRFLTNHCVQMQVRKDQHVLLILDFDNDPKRFAIVKDQIPPEVKERVYILGSLSTPEALRSDLGSFETIGLRLAQACWNNTNDGWEHRLLAHNAPEVERMRRQVHPFLF